MEELPPLIAPEDLILITRGKGLIKPELDALKQLVRLPHGNGTIAGNREMLRKHVKGALLKLSGNHAR